MDDFPEERTVPDSDLAAMVAAVDPTWDLREATLAERGFCSVYRVVVDADGRAREFYLKASPDGRPWGIPTEARIQAVLDAHTSVPVPEVVGVVDEHDDLPSPYYLMTALPGEDVAYERVCRFDDDVLRRLARENGAYLGELHSVPAVERFGHVRHDDAVLAGGRPATDPDALTVGDPREEWPQYLRDVVDEELARHADSRFADLTDDLAVWFDAEIEALDGPFDPVLGRNDHGLHNLLVDPATGAVSAMIDWGYTLAVPAAYDFEFAVHLYGGSFMAGLPDVRDRRSLVREAMLAGYREAAPDRVAAVSTPEPLYEAVAMLRMMNDFGNLDVPDEHEAAAVDRVAADVRALLD